MLTLWACLAVTADARQAAEPAGGPGGESDPIVCWWRTDRRAVHVGERFTLTLTCGVLETSALRVVTDRDRLDPAALDLTPFEVVGGVRHEDFQSPPRRYFQYSYTLRLLADNLFGRDVDIPSVPITYNVETSGVTGTRGRDQLYLLPALPVRMLSLVPATATDIQDAWPDTFGDIDRRVLRATGEIAAAGVLLTFAAVLAGVSVVRIARPRMRAATERSLLSPVEMLRACIREALRVKSATEREGWSPDLIGGSSTVLRIASAIALGRPVAQRVVEAGVAAQDGELAVRKGALSTTRVAISAATTSAAIAAGLTGSKGATVDPRLRMNVEELGESLRVFAAARYSRSGALDTTALDASLRSGIEALRRLQAMEQWPARTIEALSRATDRVRGVWDR